MIEVKDLSFSYTSQPFIHDISFSVGQGEIFGFLGPSGAGKSTLQKILTGLLKSYTGFVRVAGQDPRRHDRQFYEQIGVDFEFPCHYEKLTAKENLLFFGSLYKHKSDPDDMMARLGLMEDADKKVSEYSKGMKSRLNFIKALLHNPSVLFLDEPTSGLDPTNASLLKEIILEEKDRGKTIILTTHNMYDATELCDQVAFIVDGKIKALDSPRNLIYSRGASQVTYTYRENNTLIEKKYLSIKLPMTMY